MATSPQKEGFVTPNSPLSSPKCSQSRYGRIRKPKLSSDFCSIDDAFFDGEHRPSDSPKNVQVTPKRNTKKTTAKHPEQSPSKVPLVTKTVAVNEEDLDTRDPVDLELVIPTNEISADNLWDTQILKANTNTSKQFKSSEETYKERKFFKRTPENEDAKQSSSAVCMENETKTSETVKNESTKHNHSLTDVEKDVTKVLKIVSNKNTEISLDNANTKVDVKSALKTYTNKRKSGGTTFSLPNKSGVPTNSRKTRKSSQCDVKIDLKPSQNEETLLDFSWEQNYLSESDVVLLTKQIYEDDVESFSSDHDKNIGESSKETNRVVGTILERKIYVKGDVPQKEMKTEIVVSVDNEINKPIVQKQTVKESKQNEIDLNKSNLKNERNKLLEENEDEVMVEQITCNNSSNKDGNVSVNESIVNQSITKGMITENNNTESNLNKEQMTNKNKQFKTKLVTPKRSTRSSTNKSEETELKIVKSDEDMKTKLEDSLNQSEDLCVKNVEETTDKEDDKKSLRESKIEEESSHITEEEKVLNTRNKTKCDESIELAHKNNNSEDSHTIKIEEKILESSEKLLVEDKSSIDTNEEKTLNTDKCKHISPKRSKKSEVVEVKIMEETEYDIHVNEELALNPIEETATRKNKNKRSTHNKSNKREDLEPKKAPKNANKTNLVSNNNEGKEGKCLSENSSPKLDKSKHHKRNCEDLGTNVLEKNKFNEELKKSKEESSSTDFIEEKEAPKKVKRVKRNQSKKNEGVEVHENVAENLDKADVMPDKKEETPVEEKSSSEITKKRVVSKKSSTKRNNENKGLEINGTEQTVKEEGADVSKIEDITEEKLMNQNKKSPPESHKTKRFTRNSRNYTNEDPSEIKIAIEKLNEDQVMSKNEEIRPKENSNYEDIKDIPFSERTNKKLKKLNRPKNKKMEVVQIEDSTTIISKTKGSGNLLTESLETSACDGEENDTKMNKLAADTTNKIVIKSKPAFKTKSIKLNNKKTKVRSLKSGNETNVQLKQKQMQNNQVKKMKVKTGKQLFVRLYRLKSVPNLPTVKTKIKRHNLRSNSVPSSIVIVRKKNNKKNVRKLDRGADPNKKIGSKNKPKKEIFSEPKLEEENVKNENDTKGEAANKKLAVQATVLQETKKESCDCVMCSVSLKCYRKGRKKSKSAQKNMLKKSASQSDIQKIDENKIEKSTPLKVSKKRIKSLPNLNPNDSETFAVVNSSADDKLNSEESTNFKEPSVNDVDFKTPTPRKRGRPKSLTNISRDLNKTSPAVYESSQKSEMSLTRSKSTPKKFINEPSAEFSVIVNEDKCKSLVENEAISKATTSSNKRPRGRPRKRVLKSSVVSKLVKEQPNVINQSRKRKRLKSENKGEKIQNLGTVKTNDNNLDNSQDQNVMITPKLEKPNYKNSPLKKTKLHSVNKNCEPDNNENDVQAESPKRKKRKIDDTPKNNKIEDVQDFTKKEEQFAEGTCKVGDLLWAKIGQHPYWPCMVTTDPKTELFRRRNESGKWKEWWFHVRFFGDNGLRSWVYSKNTLPFKSKDDLDELAEEAKSNKKLSDVYLSYKKMSTLKYDKWKAGVNEAESLIDKTIDEKFNFFFERFASRREKKGKLLNAIIDDSLLNNKQKKKLKMSILGRLTAKKIRKIMQKTSSDAFPDAIDFKGTFSSTPVKLRKIKQLNLSKSITEDIAEIAQKIKFESVDTTNATNESEFEVDASTNELPKKKSNLGQTIEKQLTKTPKNKKKLLGESVQNNSLGGINEEVSKPVESKEIKTDVVFLKNEELPSVEKKPILVKPSKSKRKMKSPVKRIIIPNDFNEGVYSSSEMKLKEPLNQSESKLNAEKNDDCKNVPVVTEIKIKMEPPEETVEDVIPTQKTNVLEVTKNKRKVQIFDGPPKFSSDLLANDVTSNEDVIIKEKVKKKKPDKVPNADISDASLKPKKKSSNQAKTETKIDGNVIIKTEKPDEVTSNDADLNKVEVTPELDETKTILVSLQNQVELYKRNNLFRGVTKKQVCQICEKGTDVVKCKGPCLGYFHVSCALKKGDPPPPANVDDMSSNDVIENSDVEIVTVDPKADIPDVLLSPETKILSLEDQIDLKMKEIMSKQSNKPTYEDVILECSNSSDDLSNKTKSKKEKKILKIHHVTADYVSYISIPEKSGETNETETIKSVEYIPTTNLDESLIPVKEENIFKCSDCASETNPQCFVCKKLVSNKNSDVRQKCANSNCGRFYHQDCLKRWPQTQWSITSKSKGSKQIFFCPLHVCHTCVSDNPRGSISKSSNENAKCMRCPATYHTSSYCIPAGTVILSNTQIICPRHLCEGIEKKSDKLVSKTVNASWCFLCSKSGGTLICCETCPTSVHEECLNIDSKLDDEDSCVCEDCETGRLPLYDEIVWVKLGAYRWWPAVILFPNEVPRNVQNMPHYKGQFVVKFFGTHDHYWVGRGRVFLFQEGDSTHKSQSKKQVDVIFNKAVEEASVAHQLKKDFKKSKEQEIKSDLKPPPYIKIKVNKPVGNVKQYEGNSSNTTACECNPDQPNPCGPDSVCLNRLLLTECNPEVCPAGAKCNNQLFEKRLYPPLVAFKTSSSGWGLKSLVPLYRGQFIIEYVGEVIDEEEYQRRILRMHEMKEENYYFLTIDKDRIIDAGPKGNLARFMNHSCQPNCETQKWTVNGDTRVGLFASVDIPENTELTFNYNLEYVSKEKKACRCGARNCVGFIGAKPVPKKIPKKKKPSPPPPVVVNSGPCFICGEEGQVGSCCNKICTKFYHLKCVNLESWPDKWVCPWHNCNLCTKRTIRCCVKCTNSYCPSHSDGNVRYDKLLGFVCTDHDPNKETHVLQIEDICRTPATFVTTAETDITSTTPDTTSSVEEHVNPPSIEDDEVSEITSNTQEIDIEKEKLKYAFFECQEKGVIPNNITESSLKAVQNKLKVAENEGSNKRKRSKPKRQEICDGGRSKTVTPSTDKTSDSDEELISKRKAEFDKDLPMRKRKKPRIEL